MHTHHTTIDCFDRFGALRTVAYLVKASCAGEARLRAWRLLLKNYADEFAGATLAAVSVRTGPVYGPEGRRRSRQRLQVLAKVSP